MFVLNWPMDSLDKSVIFIMLMMKINLSYFWMIVVNKVKTLIFSHCVWNYCIKLFFIIIHMVLFLSLLYMLCDCYFYFGSMSSYPGNMSASGWWRMMLRNTLLSCANVHLLLLLLLLVRVVEHYGIHVMLSWFFGW